MKIIYTQIPDVDGFRFRAVDQRCLGIHIQPTIVFHLQIFLQKDKQKSPTKGRQPLQFRYTNP
ncbi:hypothetical protein QR98_0033310 [Sarcoptes scabiei]|uniref:Uncharacterized protein n=1 Tax=Sarcoptes scabiei TaxID=52283 RepID=A0A132A1N6_SARSC|nr:hypothetical protein QR98_0033310 [Sarcoptes scabiei]